MTCAAFLPDCKRQDRGPESGAKESESNRTSSVGKSEHRANQEERCRRLDRDGGPRCHAGSKRVQAGSVVSEQRAGTKIQGDERRDRGRKVGEPSQSEGLR